MAANPIIPAVITSFVAWRVYMRVRRNVGRQPWQPKRMLVRLIIFAVICLLFGLLALMKQEVLIGYAAGLALSLPLGWLAVKLTHLEATAEGRFYTPNTWIGLALSLLFVGRIAYRMIMIFSQPVVQQGPPSLDSYVQSPLTFGIFGLTYGFYIMYYGTLLAQGHKLHAPTDGPTSRP